jgi:hypothetical protein
MSATLVCFAGAKVTIFFLFNKFYLNFFSLRARNYRYLPFRDSKDAISRLQICRFEGLKMPFRIIGGVDMVFQPKFRVDGMRAKRGEKHQK